MRDEIDIDLKQFMRRLVKPGAIKHTAGTNKQAQTPPGKRTFRPKGEHTLAASVAATIDKLSTGLPLQIKPQPVEEAIDWTNRAKPPGKWKKKDARQGEMGESPNVTGAKTPAKRPVKTIDADQEGDSNTMEIGRDEDVPNNDPIDQSDGPIGLPEAGRNPGELSSPDFSENLDTLKPKPARKGPTKVKATPKEYGRSIDRWMHGGQAVGGDE